MRKEKKMEVGGKEGAYPGKTKRVRGSRTFFSKISQRRRLLLVGQRAGGEERREPGDAPRTGSTRRRIFSRTPKSEGAASCSCVRGRREPRGFSWE